jgi:hypothetical protein
MKCSSCEEPALQVPDGCRSFRSPRRPSHEKRREGMKVNARPERKNHCLFSPLTYFTDIVRLLFINRGFYGLALDFLALLAFLITFTIAAIKIHERTLTKRL